VVTGAYKATTTEALEIETHTLPMDIFLDKMVARSTLRTGATQVKAVVDAATKRIRQQMRSKRGRQAKIRKTLGQRKEEWLTRKIGETREREQERGWEAPWDT